MYRSDSLFSAPASSILASPLQRSPKTLDEMSSCASKSGHERPAKLGQRGARRDFPRGEELRGLLEIIPQEVLHIWFDDDIGRAPPFQVGVPLQNGEGKADHIHDALGLPVVGSLQK